MVSDFVYFVSTDGDIQRYPVVEYGAGVVRVDVDGGVQELVESGTELHGADGGLYYHGSSEWDAWYQKSLAERMSRSIVVVYFVQLVEVVKDKNLVLVIDGEGYSYTTRVRGSSFKFGESLKRKRGELSLVSLSPMIELLDMVNRVRSGDSNLV